MVAPPQGIITKKYWLQDHDIAIITKIPPVLNTWYTVIDVDDVRLIEFYILQSNNETAAKDVEVRWTLDGQVYLISVSVPDTFPIYINKNMVGSNGGTSGLSLNPVEISANLFDFVCALHAKLEVRLTSAAGTAQLLGAVCKYETFEET
jgi:hypothetical protein